MTTWDTKTIEAISRSDDLHIYPYRADGRTLGTPTWIWSVVVDGRLFVRAWNGTRGRRYRSAITQKAGRIDAAGQTFDVRFEKADPSLADAISAAYERKYAGSPYLPPMLGADQREAAVEITPATTAS